MDGAAWFQKKLWFADSENKYVLMWRGSVVPLFAINTKLASPAEFKSYSDLLNPTHVEAQITLKVLTQDELKYLSGPLGGWRHKHAIEPRLEAGRKLIGKATACMDISDGLALDLHRLAMASGVQAHIDSVPLLKGATLEQALHDGEDYELLYTAAPGVRLPGIRVGCIGAGKPGALRYAGKRVAPRGYDHLSHRT